MIMYYFFVCITIFIGVIFVTLLERKFLGLIQYRVGPNKVMLKGFIQSITDALKLLSKQGLFFFFLSGLEYNIMPMGMLFLMLLLWIIIPNSMYDYSNSILMMLCILSLSVYPIMYGSWFSGSLYSKLGSIRSISQMISYEVSMIMIIISLIVFPKSFNLYKFMGVGYFAVFMVLYLLMVILFVSLLSELGRTPVDLLEGESELVSGFNTEFYGMKFALIFLSEYGMIMFFSGLMSITMLGAMSFNFIWMFFTMMIIFLIIWVRGILPRIRYDKLMSLCWVSILNLSLGILSMNMGVISIM